MKKRPLLLVIVVLVLLLLSWLLRARRAPSIGEATPAQEATSQESADTTTPASPSVPPTPASTPDKGEFFRDIAQKSNRPIQFYGKVIDQDENPIPDVKVTLGIRTTKLIAGLTGDAFDYPVVTTDAQGRFTITDAKGALLTVKALEKEGYEPSIKKINQAYWYWRDPSQVFTPNPDAPEVFRMWRKEGAEYLVVKGVSKRIPYDGTATSFDLLTGKATASGDLRITLLRDPQQIKRGQRNYEWTAIIEVPQGGLILSEDEQMFRAPEQGYQPKLGIHVAANSPGWSDMKDIAVYLKLRDGKYYGRATLSLMVGSDNPEGTPFNMRSAVNPSGSRNLEYDSAQNITKDPPPRTRTATPTP